MEKPLAVCMSSRQCHVGVHPLPSSSYSNVTPETRWMIDGIKCGAVFSVYGGTRRTSHYWSYCGKLLPQLVSLHVTQTLQNQDRHKHGQRWRYNDAEEMSSF